MKMCRLDVPLDFASSWLTTNRANAASNVAPVLQKRVSIRASRERVCLTSVCPLFNTPSEKMIQRGRDDAYACPYVMAYERKKPKATVAGARAPSPHQYSRRRLATLMDAARMRGRVGGLGIAAREHGAARCMRRPVAFRLSACASRVRVRYE